MNPVFDKKQIRGLNWKFWSCLKLIRPFAMIKQGLAQKAKKFQSNSAEAQLKEENYSWNVTKNVVKFLPECQYHG